MSKSKKQNVNMYKAILSLKDIRECQEFFEDVCSMSELHSMEQRYEVAEMLLDEKVYTEIMKETGASSATVSRVKRMLFYGTGCLNKVMKRLRASDAKTD
ncbi:MAG: TrpR-like protein [Eubacterium sp.]|nr:TrpR-like protein [Lachnospiraceae bacterium]MBQ9322566.1 TrpR-like protein [Eubacterium sp.]